MADETDLINRLAAAVADRIRPQTQIPFEYEMWDIATIAACMKLSEAQVRERLAPQPDFPKAIRLPTATGGRRMAFGKSGAAARLSKSHSPTDGHRR